MNALWRAMELFLKDHQSQIYLTCKEASERTRLSQAYLAKLRHFGGSCPYYRANARTLLYRLDELDEWMEQRRFANTSGGQAPQRLAL
ncbi:MAG: hypothetical protein ABL889_15680 [Terricaulis sp.]